MTESAREQEDRPRRRYVFRDERGRVRVVELDDTTHTSRDAQTAGVMFEGRSYIARLALPGELENLPHAYTTQEGKD